MFNLLNQILGIGIFSLTSIYILVSLAKFVWSDLTKRG